MKKMIFAIVAMLVMTMSANAQGDNDQQLTFDRVSSYLELRVDQVEPVKKTMAQLDSSLEAIHQLKDKSKGYEAWQKIEANHMAKMQRILSQNQYDKYVIFTTAFKEYAFESYEVNALDFLLKPIRYNKFLAAIEKARKQPAREDGPIPMAAEESF